VTSYSGPPFRLKKIRIKNVRCFHDLTIDLSTRRGTRNWAVIFGDNGVGKTTLLRCIAMGLCDEASAAGLLREIYGDWHTKLNGHAPESLVEITFSSRKGDATVRTRIIPNKSGYSHVKQEFEGLHRDDFPWDAIFACGYGAARRSFGTRDIGEYATIDSVYTLFNYDTPLQNPELVIRRLLGRSDSRATQKGTRTATTRRLLESIASILMLDRNAIKLTNRGLTVHGAWGSFQPVGGLGDGFQATLSWLMDFVGWAILYDNQVARGKSIRGIVLLDEIEQHLHPRWQREIIKLLHDHFPDVQFIVTTHTPMCAIGTTDLSSDECELIKLERTANGVVACENIEPPRGQRADQILTSFLFELPTTADDRTIARIARFNQLQVKTARSQSEERELRAISSALRSDLAQDEGDFERVVREEVRAALTRRALKQISLVAADAGVRHLLGEMRRDEESRLHGTEKRSLEAVEGPLRER
jgi:predicted ATPase